MAVFVKLGKDILSAGSKIIIKKLKKLGAKPIPKKEVTPAVKAKAKTVTKENISDQYPGMIRKIPTGKRSMTEAQMKKAVKKGGVPVYDTTKPIPRLGKTPVGGWATAGEPRGALDRAKKNVKREELNKKSRVAKTKIKTAEHKEREAYKKKHLVYPEDDPRNYPLHDKGAQAAKKRMLKAGTLKKGGGQIKGKPVNGIKRAGKPVNGIKGTKVAALPAWMKGLTADQIKQILGAPTADPSGVVRHSKKKTKKPTKVRKAKGGGMTGEGLYPAEEARSGTMSQARRKKYMKKGGKVISYKMTGGQVVDAGYD